MENPLGSSNESAASAKCTPCFLALASAFTGSHSYSPSVIVCTHVHSGQFSLRQADAKIYRVLTDINLRFKSFFEKPPQRSLEEVA